MMKALVCEMCSGNDVIKQDGYYVCQHCGTKYSVEEARKMMVEGTVKIDNSDELKNLYELARRAKDNDNSEYAKKYYDEILIKDPSSWEANFYSVYYQALSCSIAGIESAANRIINCEVTVLELLRTSTNDAKLRNIALSEMSDKLMELSKVFCYVATKHYDGISESMRYRYQQDMVNRVAAARNIVYTFGDTIASVFGSYFVTSGGAVECWKYGLTIHCALMEYLTKKEANYEIINSYAQKVRKYNSNYQLPKISGNNGGCYIATAVYGSYDCPQVWTLRRYRDDTLAKTWHGRCFVHMYYTISPTLVKLFGETKWFKKLWKGRLDKMVADLQAEGVKSTPYIDKKW